LPLEELDFAASTANAAGAPRAACAVPLEGDGERAFNAAGAITGKGPLSTIGIGPLAAGCAVALRVAACLAGDGERADADESAERAVRAVRALSTAVAAVAFLSSSYK